MTKHTTERKKLLKRFKGFRAIIGDDIGTLDPALIARLDDTVEALERPIRVVIAGLADARHHALTSRLAGMPLAATAEAAMGCPALLIRAGSEPRTTATVSGNDRTFKGCVLDKLITMEMRELVTLQLPDMMMPHIELSVLPVYDTQDDRSRYLFDLVEQSNAIIWCSDAASPWQPRERRLWFTVPDDLKSLSILALTGPEAQADDAATKAALDEKCEFTQGEFAQTVPVHYDEDGFAQNVSALIEALAAMVDEPVLAEARTLRSELDKIPIGAAVAAPGPAPVLSATPDVAESVEDTDPVADLRGSISRNASACIEAVESSTTNDRSAVFDAMTALLSEASDALKGEVSLSRDHDAMAAQVDEATDLVNLLSYEGTAQAVQEAADLACQIAADILDRLPMTGEGEQVATNTLKKAS